MDRKLAMSQARIGSLIGAIAGSMVGGLVGGGPLAFLGFMAGCVLGCIGEALRATEQS